MECGRGWLDVQRYVEPRMLELGSYYDPIRKAVISRIAGAAGGYPQLSGPDHDGRYADGERGDAGVDAGAGAPAAARVRASRCRGESWTRRDEPRSRARRRTRTNWPCRRRGRAGRRRASRLLMRELGQERSGRGRFHRKVQLAQLCVSTGHENIALPILQELAAEIERRKLEDWEPPELVARPLALLYQCLARARRRTAEKRRLYVLDLPSGSAEGDERVEITYGALGTGTDSHTIGAGAADRPRARRADGSAADARAIGAAVEGFAAARPGVAAEYAAHAGSGGQRVSGTGAIGLQLRAAGPERAELANRRATVSGWRG